MNTITDETREGLLQMIDDLRSNLRCSQAVAVGWPDARRRAELGRYLQLCRDSLDGIRAMVDTFTKEATR